MNDANLICHSLFDKARGTMWRLFPEHQPVSHTRLGFLCAMRFVLDGDEQEIQVCVDNPGRKGWVVHLSHHFHDYRYSMTGTAMRVPVQDYSEAWLERGLRQLIKPCGVGKCVAGGS